MPVSDRYDPKYLASISSAWSYLLKTIRTQLDSAFYFLSFVFYFFNIIPEVNKQVSMIPTISMPQIRLLPKHYVVSWLVLWFSSVQNKKIESFPTSVWNPILPSQNKKVP